MKTELRNRYHIIFMIVVIIISTACIKKLKNSTDGTGTATKVGGIYTKGTTPEKGETGKLYMYPVSDSTLLFHVDLNRGKPSYNNGAISGIVKIKQGNGYFESDKEGLSCRIVFEFFTDYVEVNTDKIKCNCGFGYGVSAEGKYLLVSSEIPSEFIDRHGDVIRFETLKKLLELER